MTHDYKRLVDAGNVRVRTLPQATPDLIGGAVYLATPYSLRADLPGGLCKAWEDAVDWLAVLTFHGVSCCAPIAQSHQACASAQARLNPLDAKFWAEICRPWLERATAVVVPPIPGWDESVGIWHEVNDAISRCVPVYLIAGIPE